MTVSQTFETGDNCYLSDISPDDKPWDTHRAQSDEIARLYGLVGYDRYSQRVSGCSQWLTYALKANDDGEFRLKLRDARFCRVRHCPVCQWRRSMMWRAKFFKALPAVQDKYPTGRWLFLTLTVRNCALTDLRQTLQSMNAAWQRLIQRKGFPALGFIKSVEVTRGKDRSAHPHFHCLLLVPAGYFSRGFISQAKWTELWKSCLKADYNPVIDVRAVKDKSPALNATLDTGNGALMKAICETLKYTVKESDLIADPDWLQELTRQLHKTRAIAIGGVLKEFLSDEDPEDLINGDIEEEEKTEDEVNILFDWAEIIRRYKKR